MRYRPNPKVIGGFVMGAIVLALVAAVLLGGGRYFEATRQAVAYFDRSVAGLSTGAPVTFRGVRVGQVKNIALRVEADDLRARIPVVMEFQLDRIDWAGAKGFTQEQFDRLIERGLRAKLVPQSFVTGQLSVELGFEPQTKVRMVGARDDMPEIPTARSEFEALKSSLQDLPLKELLARALQAVDRINALLDQPAMRELGPEALATLRAYRKLAEETRSTLPPLARSLQDGASAATATLDQTRRSVESVEGEVSRTLDVLRGAATTLEARVGPLADKLATGSEAATDAFRKAQDSLDKADRLLEPGSATQRDLRRALDEFARAARAVRALAEQLERNPNALITGKGR
jgi:paraquat-inducible protein B